MGKVWVRSEEEGDWVEVVRPWLKRASGWTRLKYVWVKRAGAWVQAFEYDLTPSAIPDLSVDLVQKHLKIGVRLPGVAHDTDLAEIRVLIRHDKPDTKEADSAGYPASYADTGYKGSPDKTFPDEPWSKYFYNGFDIAAGKCHPDSSVYVYKEYPVNAGTDTKVDPGTYFVAAWSRDGNDNWSARQTAKFVVPKSYDVPTVTRTASFQARTSGTWVAGSTYTPGDLTQSRGPSRGIFYYGNQFKDNIGKADQPVKIKSGQIRIARGADDGGEASANVYLYWHNHDAVGGAEPSTSNVAKIGTIPKGETGAWLNIPRTHLDELAKDLTKTSAIKGFGLFHKDPNKEGVLPDDFFVCPGVDDESHIRVGEISLTWTEGGQASASDDK